MFVGEPNPLTTTSNRTLTSKKTKNASPTYPIGNFKGCFFRTETLRGWARSNDPNTPAYLDFFQRDLDGNLKVGNKASITLLGNDGGYQSLSKAVLLDGRGGIERGTLRFP